MTKIQLCLSTVLTLAAGAAVVGCTKESDRVIDLGTGNGGFLSGGGGGAATSPQPSAPAVVFATGLLGVGDGYAFELDTSDGSTRPMGSQGLQGTIDPAGAAFDPATNRLYLIDRDKVAVLFSADPATGDLTLVGLIGGDEPESLTFDPNTNTLYAVDADDRLRTIDPATGRSVYLGTLAGVSGTIEGLALDSLSNTLYGATGNLNSRLYSFDPVTLATTFVGSTGINTIEGLTFDPTSGQLYSSDRNRQFHQIDPATAARTLIGTASRYQALALDTINGQALGFEDSDFQFEAVDLLTANDTVLGAPGQDQPTGLAFDPNTNTLYGTTDLQDALFTIDPATGVSRLVGVDPTAEPDGLAFDPNTNTLYMSDGNNRLWTYDKSNGALTQVGLVGFGSVNGLAFDPNTDTLYGSDVGSDQLITIDTTTGAGTPVGPTHGFNRVDGLAFDPSTNTLYGCDQSSDQLLVFDTGTGAATSVGPTRNSLNGLTFDPNTATLYGLGQDEDDLVRLDPSAPFQDTVPGSVGSHALRDAVYASDTDTWYAICFDSELLVLDLVTGDTQVVGDMGVRLEDLAWDSATGKLYGLENSGTDRFYEIDRSTGGLTLIGPLTTTGAWNAMAFDASGTLYAVRGSNELHTIDPATGANTLVVGISAPSTVHGLAFDTTGRMLACMQGADQLLEINPTTGSTTVLLTDFQANSLTGLAIGPIPQP
ncbi:hypothetical protein OAX78_01180 [Planctomycetota bacterium]|nr:hypothetical protein [Planctomycetota bacterium]